ncbi:MAG: hypothetical protein ACRDG3_00270 [Tepidiformaceae bacterium]
MLDADCSRGSAAACGGAAIVRSSAPSGGVSVASLGGRRTLAVSPAATRSTARPTSTADSAGSEEVYPLAALAGFGALDPEGSVGGVGAGAGEAVRWTGGGADVSTLRATSVGWEGATGRARNVSWTKVLPGEGTGALAGAGAVFAAAGAAGGVLTSTDRATSVSGVGAAGAPAASWLTESLSRRSGRSDGDATR